MIDTQEWLLINSDQILNIYEELLITKTNLIDNESSLFLNEIEEQFNSAIYSQVGDLFSKNTLLHPDYFYDKVNEEELILWIKTISV